MGTIEPNGDGATVVWDNGGEWRGLWVEEIG